jgi:protoporphyrinogen oxidase
VRDVQVLILGAGFAGLGAGVEAQRLGMDSLILEAASTAGGLCRGVTVAGCRFDRYGPKVIVERESSRGLVELLGDEAVRHELSELVDLPGVGLVGFPVQRHLVQLPRAQRETILAEMAVARSRPGQIRCYQDWLLNAYGRYLCETVLFPYEEKKWRMPLSEMDYQWALGRPVSVSYEEAVRGASARLPPSRTYFYPRQGTLSGLVALLVARAGAVRCDAQVAEIDPAARTVSAAGETYRYEHLVSSLPLDQVVRMTVGFDPGIAAVTASLLRWLSVRVYNLVFDHAIPLSGDTVYFPDRAVSFRRVAILQNLCPALPAPGRTALSVEVSIGPDDHRTPAPDRLPEVLRELRTVAQFQRLGPLLGSDAVDIPEAYPQQRDGLREHVALLIQMYRQWRVWQCGRAGTFDYCDLDVAFEQGRRVVRQAATTGAAAWTS